MTPATFRIGLLFSSTGPYAVVARSMLNGALLAVDEFNAASGGPRLEAVVVNPGGELSRYSELSADLLQSGIRHVVGCYTSSSRKEVIPVFEKHDALLWYPSHYEGFETSGNVVYTGAAPNQHILPLIEHMTTLAGNRVYCVGSNYIWAWENNRIMREAITARGGQVVAERYLPVGETDVTKSVEEILALRPDFIFNTLIGNSAYQFLRALRLACAARGLDQPAVLPVASCSLSEPELEEIGPEAVDGHFSSSVYFATVESSANRRFLDAYAAAYPNGPTLSADAEASYVAVAILGRALEAAGTDAIEPVRAVVPQIALEAPQGPVRIDPATMHAYLTPRIGRSTRDGRFDVVMAASAPIAPDPYLVQSTPRFAVAPKPSHLRLVQ
ncbi:transporter substrate-binding domain-containing protein [Chthonobacter albigriseus]|uniref:transporter substrate-binding domain-containing protein n=1 Tax=Chthonobacter albigriseus TaxID=1683161 RepID=UPI0015EEEB79|nr:transporter substrate-binding domain-containing protein [Chthonobacter albigriseus]